MTKKQKKVLIRIIIASVLIILLKLVFHFVNVNKYVELIAFLVPYFVIGYDILKKAVYGIFNRQVFDENFLMAIATVGAIALGEYVEGTAVMLFYQIGELFQSYAVGKSRKNITALMDIRPDYANIEVDGKLEQVDPDDVEVGSVIVVKPGEKIPIDGIVVEGSSTLNTSALTGESVPRSAKEGEEVISGCVNLTGLLKIKTDKEFGDSTVSKILDLVENSSMKKSRSENFITRFAKVYTPAVCIGALALAVIPPVVNFVMGNSSEWSKWLIRALTTLVISCPCALVISIPLSFFGGIGGASSRGILIKGSNYLEILSKAKYIVCDKTGTLTKGVFEVTDVVTANSYQKEELLKLAAYAESYSTHPISKSIRNAYKKDIDTNVISDIEEISGHGVCADIKGRKILAGNKKLMEQYGIDTTPTQAFIDKKTGTLVYVSVDGVYAGCIIISDIIKPTSAKAVKDLKKAGVKKVVMLTGDNNETARIIADKLQITEVVSNVSPQEKLEKIKELNQNKNCLMVGDGINDSPALKVATVGVSVQNGTDISNDASDVILLNENMETVCELFNIGNKTIKIIKENLFWALFYNVCMIPLATGLFQLSINPMFASLAMTLSSFTVVINSLRLI